MNTLSRNVTVVCVLVISMLACGVAAPATQPPTVPPPTLPLMVQPIQLLPIPYGEDSQSPIYTITAQIPYLGESTDPGVQAFNVELRTIVEEEIALFKRGTSELPAEPISAGSSFDARYELISQKGNLWSIKFNFSVYMDGAAHPYSYSRTVNYDLENGADVPIELLFLPSSNYLQVIADYCKAQLAARDIAFDPAFTPGADAAPINYERWNVSEDGLIITFDQGQVAAYAAGPQTVIVPFDVLKNVIDIQGPLAPYLP